MFDVKFIPRQIRCTKCGRCKYYDSTKQLYRCARGGCNITISWTTGTTFANLRNGLRCVHIVAIFVARLIFEDSKSTVELARRFNIPVSWVDEYFTELDTIFDSWKTSPNLKLTLELPPPADVMASLTGYKLFIRSTPLESRIPRFFQIFKEYSQLRCSEFPTEVSSEG